MTVARIIAESELDPSLLTLELTETVLLKDIQQGREHMVKLRKSGVRIALDDFGTGYSSLSYLQGLPADVVKLDHAFVGREFGEMPSVLGSVIEMAHRIGLQVVAEGVETQEQSELLRSMDCDELKGYFFSKAPPSDRGPFLPSITRTRGQDFRRSRRGSIFEGAHGSCPRIRRSRSGGGRNQCRFRVKNCLRAAAWLSRATVEASGDFLNSFSNRAASMNR